MKTDVNGCSTCLAGQGHYDEFKTWDGRTQVQYDYRHPSGKLFSCIASSPETARAKRDLWLVQEGLSQA